MMVEEEEARGGKDVQLLIPGVPLRKRLEGDGLSEGWKRFLASEVCACRTPE